MLHPPPPLHKPVTITINPVKQPNPTLPKLKGFKVAQLNIASLPKHYEELFIYMRDEPFDILT